MLFDLKESPALDSVMSFVVNPSSSEMPLFWARSACYRPIPCTAFSFGSSKKHSQATREQPSIVERRKTCFKLIRGILNNVSLIFSSLKK
jgi:hypothetical protein